MKCPTTYAWENDLVQKFKSENNSASFKYQQFYLMKGAKWRRRVRVIFSKKQGVICSSLQAMLITINIYSFINFYIKSKISGSFGYEKYV